MEATRILEAADAVFLAGGPSASTEDVAATAGVGIATVFRHFPTKRDLLEEVVARRFDRLAALAEDALAAAEPRAAFRDFVRAVVVDAAGKVALSEILIAAGGGHGPSAQASKLLRRRFGLVLRRTQDEGAVRSDLTAAEAWALVVATARAAAGLGPLSAARLVDVLDAGLRPPS